MYNLSGGSTGSLLFLSSFTFDDDAAVICSIGGETVSRFTSFDGGGGWDEYRIIIDRLTILPQSLVSPLLHRSLPIWVVSSWKMDHHYHQPISFPSDKLFGQIHVRNVSNDTLLFGRKGVTKLWSGWKFRRGLGADPGTTTAYNVYV